MHMWEKNHTKTCECVSERNTVTMDECFWINAPQWCAWEKQNKKTTTTKTLLPSVNTLIAQGIFCGAKYTHHTLSPIVKHLITTANKYPGKKSFIDKNMTNPTGIKLCISHQMATSWGPPPKSYCPDKSNYKNCLQQLN